MSLVFIFLCATNQANALNIDETFDFYKNLGGWKGIGFDVLNEAKKKDFIENKFEEDSAQALVFETDGDNCVWEREDMSLSRSLISKSMELQQKFNF